MLPLGDRYYAHSAARMAQIRTRMLTTIMDWGNPQSWHKVDEITAEADVEWHRLHRGDHVFCFLCFRPAPRAQSVVFEEGLICHHAAHHACERRLRAVMAEDRGGVSQWRPDFCPFRHLGVTAGRHADEKPYSGWLLFIPPRPVVFFQ